MRRAAVLIGTILATLLGAAPAFGAGTPDSAVPRFGHVFLIIGENTDYSHINPTNTPYLMGTVRPGAAWFDSYYSATHWSQANYVAMVTGQFTNCEQHDGGVSCHQNIDNLYARLDAAHLSWKVWLEAGSAKCDTGSGGSCSSNVACPLSGFYTTGNPPILFDDIEGPGGVWSASTPSQECLANDIPAGSPTDGMGTFNADLALGQVAAFNTVIPNGCEDGESNCKPVNNRYTQFDDFLATEVPLIEHSPAFGKDGVIIIAYDESDRADGQDPPLGGGGHTMCAVISPLVKPGESSAVTYVYSMLRTLQDGFGVVAPRYLGAANQVSPLPVSWR